MIDKPGGIEYNEKSYDRYQEPFVRKTDTAERNHKMSHDLLKTMEEKLPTFSKGQRQITHFLLDHYDRAAYMTASKLGRETGVSESTVVRFAIELGYEGYPEFQKALQEVVRMKLTSVQRVAVTDQLIGEGDVLEKVLMSDVDKIRRTLDGIDRRVFEEAVDRIISAKNIYIIGVRSSSCLAGFLNYSLRMIFDNVRQVQPTSGSEMFEQIVQIGEGDVMLAVSFPRYSKKIINAVGYAKDAGADIISITDSPESPIAAKGDQVLYAQSDMAAFVDSLVAPLSIINAIIVAVARKKRDQVTERLRKLETIWDEYDVYAKSQN